LLGGENLAGDAIFRPTKVGVSVVPKLIAIRAPPKSKGIATMKKMPKELLIYVCETLDDDTPIFGVARNVDEIPEDSNGDKVGVYTLNRACDFRVRRELSE
jgi:hypothetical protein